MAQDPTNVDRSQWAQEAINTYADVVGLDPKEELDSCLGDLLCDLMHLCDLHGIDFEKRLEMGYTHYHAEIAEEDEC